MSSPLRVLLTGSEGLIGKALRAYLEARGSIVVGLDLVAHGSERGDVRDPQRMAQAVAGVHGVVHLAAVSRVVWAETDPGLCWSTNVVGLRNLIARLGECESPPWLVFASSREVHGQPALLPATEDTPLAPLNAYGRSKVEGERLVMEAGQSNLRTAVVRLSNVYGRADDHADRVVPAFARAAVTGGTLRVDGSNNQFDFTHIDDAVRGIVALVEVLEGSAASLPPVQLCTGEPTSLGELASMASESSGGKVCIVEAAPRDYDVSVYYGDPARARELLGWAACVSIREGLTRLMEAFRREALR